MSFEERIERMRENGTLTADQARNMQEGIAGIDGTVSYAATHKKLPIAEIVLSSLVVIVILFLSFDLDSSGGVERDVVQNVSETLNQIEGIGAMNKNITTIVSISALIVPILLIFMFLYNGLVSKEEDVMSAWAQVEANYQRRADLIPNLVETVQGFAEHEKSVLTAVTESRAKVMSIKANPNDQASIDSMMRAQAALGRSLTMLMATVENYPQLRSADNFRALQDQLEGTENRINTVRMVFNETVNDYNASIRKMPGALVAGFGNFHRKAYFKSETGSEKVVGVDFDKESNTEVE